MKSKSVVLRTVLFSSVCALSWNVMSAQRPIPNGAVLKNEHVVITTPDKALAGQIVSKLSAMRVDESKVLIQAPNGAHRGTLSLGDLQRVGGASSLPPGVIAAGDWVKIESIWHAKNLGDLQQVLSQVDATYSLARLNSGPANR